MWKSKCSGYVQHGPIRTDSARGIGPRPPEIFEAETSTRSQGTSRKDLVLSEIDEFQGRVVPEPEPAVVFHAERHVAVGRRALRRVAPDLLRALPRGGAAERLPPRRRGAREARRARGARGARRARRVRGARGPAGRAARTEIARFAAIAELSGLAGFPELAELAEPSELAELVELARSKRRASYTVNGSFSFGTRFLRGPRVHPSLSQNLSTSTHSPIFFCAKPS